MISTDRLIFDEKSDVRARQIEYAKDYDEVHIVIFQNSKFQIPNSKISLNSFQIAPNCWVYSTQSLFKAFYPFDAIKIGKQIIKQHGITEITCQDASLTAMASVSLKKKFVIPLEIQIHEDLGSPNYAYNLTNKIRRILAQRYIPKADKVRVVSERIKRYVVSLRRDLKEIEVRPIAVDTERIKNAPILIDLHRKYRQFDKIVLMASRLEKEKNIELAIKSWPEVVKSFPKAGLIIVGSGSQISNIKSLTSYLLSLTSNNSIIIENRVDRDILVSYYKTADVFLNTSLFEGYGMTLVEARAAGCRIISTDVGVAREVGATIVEFNTSDVASTITKLLQS